MKILRKVGFVVDTKAQKKADQKNTITFMGDKYYATGKKKLGKMSGKTIFEYRTKPKNGEEPGELWADESGDVIAVK